MKLDSQGNVYQNVIVIVIITIINNYLIDAVAPQLIHSQPIEIHVLSYISLSSA